MAAISGSSTVTVTAVPVRAVPFASVQETGSEVWLTVARLLKLPSTRIWGRVWVSSVREEV